MSLIGNLTSVFERIAQEFNDLRGATKWTEIEVDFGYPPAKSKTAVVNASVTAASRILIVQATTQPAGKGTDEHEAEPVEVSAKAQTGQYKIFAQAVSGKIGGKFRFLVQIQN